MRSIYLIIAAVLLAAALTNNASAQITIEPDVVTDTIDIFKSEQQHSTKSRGLAMMSSILLPGLGHQYLGNHSRALVYYSTEMFFLFGMIFCEGYSNRLFGDAKSYAYEHAEIRGDKGESDYYWKMVGNFMGTDEFNDVMELNRTIDDKYSPLNYFWRWDDESTMEKYNEFRENATRFHVASSFFIAAMVLDRVIAFIDIRRATRQESVTGRSSLDIRPEFNPLKGSAGISVNALF